MSDAPRQLLLRMSPVLLSAQYEMVKTLGRSVRQDLAVGTGRITGDREMDAAWRASLEDALRDDCTALEALFREGEASGEGLCIDLSQAEPLLRAASAVRLRIRQSLLTSLDDHDLEQGRIAFEDLDPGQQQGYMSYLFLGNLQELLVRQLDPEASAASCDDDDDEPDEAKGAGNDEADLGNDGPDASPPPPPKDD